MLRLPILPAVFLSAALITLSLPAAAAPVLTESALGGDLAARMTRHGRQFYTFNARPFGLSLDVYAKDAASRTAIEDFLKQDAVADFKAFGSKHPYDVIADFGEHGDLGFFGGVALAGAAYEYRVLKRDGASAENLKIARDRVIRAAESWHVFYVVSGGNGVVARGIRRLGTDDLGDTDAPAIPGATPATVPLKDDEGPLPRPKDNGIDRADNSAGVLPDGTWMWIDSASKDQLVGQMFGMVALYDALSGDPTINPAIIQRMRDDALGIFKVPKTQREILGLEGCSGEGQYDLIIMDADGRPTMFHDLNPLSMEKIYLPADAPQFNVFNLFMTFAVLKSIHHVTGDNEVEEYLYKELLGNRDYLGKMKAFDGPDALSYLYMGLDTNTDVPDMTAIALFLGLYLETDDSVRASLRRYLEDGWWAPANQPFAASLSKQTLWHSLYLAVTDRNDRQSVADQLASQLAAFPAGAPTSGGYWDDARINCDETELAAGTCTAIDGKTIITIAGRDRNGTPLATEALDPSIRPNSNFNARSNPFSVNGWGSSMMLNPGGDLLASYWMGRYFELGAGGNRSPNALVHMPVGGTPEPMPDVAESPGDEGTADTATPEEVAGDDAWDLPGKPDSPSSDVSGTEVPPAGDIATDTGKDTSTPGKSAGGCSAAPISNTSPWFLVLIVGFIATLRTRRHSNTNRVYSEAQL